MRPRRTRSGRRGCCYHHTDALGSTVALSDATGTTVAANRWQPDGLLRPGIQTTGAPTDPIGWAGQYQDPGGSTYSRARQYDAPTGRSTASDPASAAAHSSTHTYASANPLVLTDPFGLWDRRGAVQGITHVAGAVSEVACTVAVVAAAIPIIGAPTAVVSGSIAVAAGAVTAGAVTAAGSAILAADTCHQRQGQLRPSHPRRRSRHRVSLPPRPTSLSSRTRSRPRWN